jgi:hypothetical protein
MDEQLDSIKAALGSLGRTLNAVANKEDVPETNCHFRIIK